MKKQIYVLAMAASLFMVSCGNSADKGSADTAEVTEKALEKKVVEKASIVGVWKMTDIDLGIEIPAGSEEEFAKIVKEMTDKTVYTFKKDGNVELVNNLGEESATYTVGEEKVTIIGKNTETMNIKELSATKLVLGSNVEDMNATMFFERR